MPVRMQRGRLIWVGPRDEKCDYWNRPLRPGDLVVPRFGAFAGARCLVLRVGRRDVRLGMPGDPPMRMDMLCKSVERADLPPPKKKRAR